MWYGGATPADATRVSVTAGSVRTGIDGQVQIGGRVTGRVTDQAGHPVAAFVHISLPADAADQTEGDGLGATDADGNYAIGNLPAGTYVLSFTPWTDTLASQYYDGETFASATRVTVRLGATTSEIDGRLAAVHAVPAGAGPAAAVSSFDRLGRTLDVSKRGVLATDVRVRCASKVSCAGQISVSVPAVATARADRSRRAPARATIATATYRLAAAHTKTVGLRLSAAGRTLLRRHHGTLTATLTLTTGDEHNTGSTRTVTTRLRSRG